MLAALLGLHRCHPTDAGFALRNVARGPSTRESRFRMASDGMQKPCGNRITVGKIKIKISDCFIIALSDAAAWSLVSFFFGWSMSAQPIARRPFVGVHKSVGSRSGGGQALYRYSATSLQPPLWQSREGGWMLLSAQIKSFSSNS